MPITIVTIVGRTLLALLFILAGAAKIAGPQPFLDHMAAHHIPGVLLPLVIALELGAGLALLLGWQLSFAAGALALFCIATALGFHLDLADKAERTLFVKDSGDCGGTDGDRRRRVERLRPEIRNGNASEIRTFRRSWPSLVAVAVRRPAPAT
jgi:putative oxidoreductase